MERVPTGIPGLDELIEGGFPKGSLVLVAGAPGSGKTIFSSQFLYQGALRYNEVGLYVSLAESREAFMRNLERLGMDFMGLEKANKIRFMDLLTVKEDAIPELLTAIINEITSINVNRMVIDSFTALAQAIRNRIDARIVLHTILSKIVRQLGCTTLLTIEIPIGTQRIGMGVEEFVADGIIILDAVVDQLEIKRRILIRKMRGTNQSLKYHNLIISNEGIRLTPLVA